MNNENEDKLNIIIQRLESINKRIDLIETKLSISIEGLKATSRGDAQGEIAKKTLEQIEKLNPQKKDEDELD